MRNNPSMVGDVWMAEVGDHGWSQLCSSYDEAVDVINERCKMHKHWAIWKNGEYWVGIWPDKP